MMKTINGHLELQIIAKLVMIEIGIQLQEKDYKKELKSVLMKIIELKKAEEGS